MDAILILGAVCIGLAIWCLKLLDEIRKLHMVGISLTKNFIAVIEGYATATVDHENFRIRVKYKEDKDDA